ncbi:MAG: glycosyltransferase family 2 protein [Gemmatimonadaceae bacterium]
MKDAAQLADGITGQAALSGDSRTKQRRAPRRGALPTLTVVIASNGSRSGLEACLASVSAQCARLDAELIVVRAAPGAEIQILGTLHPAVRFLPAPGGTTVPELRSLGMAEANGDIVVFSEDAVVRENRWLAMIMAHVFPTDAEVSASDRPFDWPAYFAASGTFTREPLGIGGR